MDDFIEEWKDLPEFDGKYAVSNMGEVFNTENDRYVHLVDTKISMQLNTFHNGKARSHQMHHLVASLFIENLNNHKYVVHKNGDHTDNRYTNLIWCKQYHIEITEPTDENWRIIQSHKNYEISKTAVIRNLYTKKEKSYHLDKDGYPKVSLRDPQGIISVHIIMARTFLDNPECKESVDHIDGNILNNNIDNLRYATMKEQAANRVKKTTDCRIEAKLKNDNRKIRRIDQNSDKEIESYNNIEEAVKYIEDNQLSNGSALVIQKRILECLRYPERSMNQTGYGYVWKYDEFVNLEGEIWKSTKEAYPDDKEFMVSNLGRVLNNKGVLVNGTKRKRGLVTIHFKRKEGTHYLHRIIADVYLPNPSNLPDVNHKDGKPWNNTLDNLEWVDKSTNAIHAINMGLCKHVKKIKTVNVSTGEEVIYNSKKEVFTTLKFSKHALDRYIDQDVEYIGLKFSTVQK
jgi:hypothetical protein